MDWLESIVLGLVQGITEFLPISSSGHLVVVPALLGWKQPPLAFDLVLHLGTLIAVIFSFRYQLLHLGRGLIGRGANPAADRRLIGLLLLGSIPAGIAGLLLGSEFESLFDQPLWVCGFWVVTAGILLGGEYLAARYLVTRPPTTPNAKRTLVIGVAQAVAITPGISRSGATISAGIAQGIEREEAARFSFLLSIPIILGAIATKIPDVVNGNFRITGPVIAGFIVAGISGWVAIEGLLKYLRTNSLRIFAYYLLIVAPISAIILELN
ncbi:MAG: undecaprenyl-diphosphatase [Actinobacteria bacterium]|jgi:undecaprenyl-diphosphatase|uniref:Undecaprenyl-diphosphatase n=1 Tax=freshwater metagenome TaxID=449393 RepID=A0A6J7N5H1_9ZZZZ|nr:undecaprenyl-diphosphate phosphatase [Actinomycetota bacterium]MSV41039.1 undecaprenyl-diphosphatase [Actinomycetota bacterium]MSV95147.1 undecaprenyl-diphosphatase [Actinomycetota bacterium]MSW61480.1 undecaprenyl-diphosphatase [Actinomycetota bacterium]